MSDDFSRNLGYLRNGTGLCVFVCIIFRRGCTTRLSNGAIAAKLDVIRSLARRRRRSHCRTKSSRAFGKTIGEFPKRTCSMKRTTALVLVMALSAMFALTELPSMAAEESADIWKATANGDVEAIKQRLEAGGGPTPCALPRGFRSHFRPQMPPGWVAFSSADALPIRCNPLWNNDLSQDDHSSFRTGWVKNSCGFGLRTP